MRAGRLSNVPTVTLALLQSSGGTVVINTLGFGSFTLNVYNPAGALADLSYIMITAIGPP